MAIAKYKYVGIFHLTMKVVYTFIFTSYRSTK